MIVRLPLILALIIVSLTGGAVAAVQPSGLGTMCTLEHATLDFGARDHTRGSATLLEIVVMCPAGVPYEISLLQTPHCDQTRLLTHNEARLVYSVLLPDRQSVWCDGSNGTSVYHSVGTGVPQHLTGYAVVRAERTQPVPSATYLDDIVVVLSTQ